MKRKKKKSQLLIPVANILKKHANSIGKTIFKLVKVTEHSFPIFGVPFLYFAIFGDRGIKHLNEKRD